MDGAQIAGSANATVVLVEFSDFECPYCQKFAAEVLPDLRSKYIDTGIIQLAFRQYPLNKLHARAQVAAEAAICAADQGKFWSMHDALFTEQARLDDSGLFSSARAIGLEREKFGECMAGGQATDRVNRDVALANRLQLVGTPVFLVGELQSRGVKVREVIRGARPFAEFERAIQAVIRAPA